MIARLTAVLSWLGPVLTRREKRAKIGRMVLKKCIVVKNRVGERMVGVCERGREGRGRDGFGGFWVC